MNSVIIFTLVILALSAYIAKLHIDNLKEKEQSKKFIDEVNDIVKESQKNYEEIEKMETGSNNNDFFKSLDVLQDINSGKSE